MTKQYLVMLLVIVCGCCQTHSPNKPAYRNVGHLRGIRLIQRGDFGEVISEVTTDQGTFLVYGYVTVGRLNDPVLISCNGFLYVPGNKPLDLVGENNE